MFYILNKSHPEMRCGLVVSAKVRKIAKTGFLSADLCSKGHWFLGHSIYSIRVNKNFFFRTWALRVSQDTEFYVDFQNIHFNCEKCTNKKWFQNNRPFSRKSGNSPKSQDNWKWLFSVLLLLCQVDIWKLKST
jgi:hypothetical protein